MPSFGGKKRQNPRKKHYKNLKKNCLKTSKTSIASKKKTMPKAPTQFLIGRRHIQINKRSPTGKENGDIIDDTMMLNGRPSGVTVEP